MTVLRCALNWMGVIISCEGGGADRTIGVLVLLAVVVGRHGVCCDVLLILSFQVDVRVRVCRAASGERSERNNKLQLHQSPQASTFHPTHVVSLVSHVMRVPTPLACHRHVRINTKDIYLNCYHSPTRLCAVSGLWRLLSPHLRMHPIAV